MIQAVIFDLDGVLVTTDDCHYQAWAQMAQEEGIYFDHDINQRLRGVSRMESLEIILERASKQYTDKEKIALATRKNGYYVALIEQLDDSALLPGALEAVRALRSAGIKLAIGSSSRNAPAILKRLGLTDLFDAIADGNQIVHSKPAPDVFLLAAKLLGIAPERCLVVEDADAGVAAGLNAGMQVLAVGAAAQNNSAHLRADTLADFDIIYYIQNSQ